MNFSSAGLTCGSAVCLWRRYCLPHSATVGKTVVCSVCLTNKEWAGAGPSLDPACLSALGRPELCVGDRGRAAASQVTHGNQSPQASEEILRGTWPEETAVRLTDFRGFRVVLEALQNTSVAYE